MLENFFSIKDFAIIRNAYREECNNNRNNTNTNMNLLLLLLLLYLPIIQTSKIMLEHKIPFRDDPSELGME